MAANASHITDAAAVVDMRGDEHLQHFRQDVPALTGSNYKGQHGKVGIMGGCREYTGAPYFAAISASKVGADLMYVFCTESASLVIKAFSPDLIVMPFVPEQPVFADGAMTASQISDLSQRSADLIVPWVRRLSCLVVGPGMGDDPLVAASARLVIRACRDANIPLIVDGSGMNIIAAQPELVKGYAKCLLTPNIAELGRIASAVHVRLDGPIGSEWQRHAHDVAAAFGGPVLVSKGPTDIITDGHRLLTCSVAATPKRCGGQGDVLAGIAGTFASWASKPHAATDLMVAAYAACLLMRVSSRAAFGEAGRAMVAPDVIQQLRPHFSQLLE